MRLQGTIVYEFYAFTFAIIDVFQIYFQQNFHFVFIFSSCFFGVIRHALCLDAYDLMLASGVSVFFFFLLMMKHSSR